MKNTYITCLCGYGSFITGFSISHLRYLASEFCLYNQSYLLQLQVCSSFYPLISLTRGSPLARVWISKLANSIILLAGPASSSIRLCSCQLEHVHPFTSLCLALYDSFTLKIFFPASSVSWNIFFYPLNLSSSSTIFVKSFFFWYLVRINYFFFHCNL